MSIRQRLVAWIAPPEQRSLTSWDLLKAHVSGWGVAPDSSEVVTHLSAEHSVATVFSCVQGIASAIGSLPAMVMRWEGDRRVEAPSHPLQRLIDRGPNEQQSWSDWLEWTMASVLLRGNALSEIRVDAAGRLAELIPIRWDLVGVVDLPGDRLAFDVSNERTGGSRRLLRDEVFWLRDRSDDGRVGVSRLRRAAGVLGAAQAINAFAGSLFKNGVNPSGTIQLEGKLSPEGFDQLRERWRQLYSGSRNAGAAMILDQGAKWQQLGINPDSAELLASRRFSCEEIARIFNTPPIMVGIWDNASFTNSEQASRWYASHCLQPWVQKIQREAKRSLFSAEAAVNHELTLDMSDLLRGSQLERWQANKLAIESGALDPDEIRQLENWPPRPAGTAPATEPVE
jgi:HK97 family phage portal protein